MGAGQGRSAEPTSGWTPLVLGRSTLGAAHGGEAPRGSADPGLAADGPGVARVEQLVERRRAERLARRGELARPTSASPTGRSTARKTPIGVGSLGESARRASANACAGSSRWASWTTRLVAVARPTISRLPSAARATPCSPSGPKRIGSPCSSGMRLKTARSLSVSGEERAVVEHRAVLVDLDERACRGARRRRAARRSCGGGRGRSCGRRTWRPRRAPARAG